MTFSQKQIDLLGKYACTNDLSIAEELANDYERTGKEFAMKAEELRNHIRLQKEKEEKAESLKRK